MINTLINMFSAQLSSDEVYQKVNSSKKLNFYLLRLQLLLFSFDVIYKKNSRIDVTRSVVCLWRKMTLNERSTSKSLICGDMGCESSPPFFVPVFPNSGVFRYWPISFYNILLILKKRHFIKKTEKSWKVLLLQTLKNFKDFYKYYFSIFFLFLD